MPRGRSGRSGGKTSEGWNPRSVSSVKESCKGTGRNQGVKGLKKPEGAAQPGAASPVQVASPCLIR